MRYDIFNTRTWEVVEGGCFGRGNAEAALEWWQTNYPDESFVIRPSRRG